LRHEDRIDRPSGALFMVVLAYWFVGRPWYMRWGATDAEVAMKLPGDEIVADRNSLMMRTIRDLAEKPG
jgi:hypothetical protein